MRGRWCTVLLVLGGLRLAGTVGGKERAPPEEQPLGCSDGEVEDDDTLDEQDRCYWEWTDEQDRFEEQELASDADGDPGWASEREENHSVKRLRCLRGRLEQNLGEREALEEPECSSS